MARTGFLSLVSFQPMTILQPLFLVVPLIIEDTQPEILP